MTKFHVFGQGGGLENVDLTKFETSSKTSLLDKCLFINVTRTGSLQVSMESRIMSLKVICGPNSIAIDGSTLGVDATK